MASGGHRADPFGNHCRAATLQFCHRAAAGNWIGHAFALRAVVAEFCGLHCVQFYSVAQLAEVASRTSRATARIQNSNSTLDLFLWTERAADYGDGRLFVSHS